MRETPPARTTVYRSHFLREMAPPGRGCVVWTVGLVSAPSYPRHLSRSQPFAGLLCVLGTCPRPVFVLRKTGYYWIQEWDEIKL